MLVLPHHYDMNALEIHGLSKTYANGVIALKGIELTVEAGDFFALLGVNGAGKSTTIGLITTLLTKTSGSISIYGYDLEKQSSLAKACLGLVPQEMNLNLFETCLQTLLDQAGYYGVARKIAMHRAEKLLKELGLWEKRHQQVRNLSGGMKRRLMIARALVHKPRVLILDEPTAGVDIEIRRSIWNFLRQTNAEGTTIILTTHYLEEAEQLCKNIAIIHHGTIIANTSMKSMLQNLRYQNLIFNTVHPIDVLPSLSPFIATKIDSHSFEVQVEQKFTLNDVFTAFQQNGIEIHSMRNKTNRLEALFWDLIHDH